MSSQVSQVTEGGGPEGLIIAIVVIAVGAFLLRNLLCSRAQENPEVSAIPIARAVRVKQKSGLRASFAKFEAIVKQKSGLRANSFAKFEAIADKYHDLGQVQRALRKAGLESSDMIVGIDFTKSNRWQGERTFQGKCLHHLDSDPRRKNPYERVISTVGRTLEDFDDDNIIPSFGFGDRLTRDKRIFSLNPAGPCRGFQDVLVQYRRAAQSVELSGPTNFAPLIDAAANIARKERSFHILLIIADGQVTNKAATVNSIVSASRDAPLSIVVVGVGDGPWKEMEEFDDELPQRRWDNFQFVDFSRTWHGHSGNSTDSDRDARFAVHALMEIPEQYKLIKKMGLLG